MDINPRAIILKISISINRDDNSKGADFIGVDTGEYEITAELDMELNEQADIVITQDGVKIEP